MTTKTITGAYASGYALSTAYDGLNVEASASIGGFGLLTNSFAAVTNYGRILATFSGANGVSMAIGGDLFNEAGGAVGGGAGKSAGAGYQPGGTGGAGAMVYTFGLVDNGGVLFGGQGGYGGVSSHYYNGGAGGAGGAAIGFALGGSVVNTGIVRGGQGGHGGAGALFSDYGGGGGAGVVLKAFGTIGNVGGEIYGGAGGVGGAYVFGSGGANRRPGNGGGGGAGIILRNGGHVEIYSGLIEGGLGGSQTAGAFYHGGNGGSGGTGIYLQAGGTVANSGTVKGGAGQAGEIGFDGGNGGAGGEGIYVAHGGRIFNFGLIEGGSGGVGGATTGGGYHGTFGFQGVGVDMLYGGILTNGSAAFKTATIDGYYGVQTGNGGPATVTNFGTISGEAGGWAVTFVSRTDVLVVEAGCVFKGGVTGGLGTLDLANGRGTFTGLTSGGNVTVSGSMATTTFQNFGTVEIGSKAQFTLNGAGAVASGQALVDAGVLSVSTLSVAGSLTLSGQLRGVGRAGVGTLNLQGGTANLDAGALLLLPHVSVSGASMVQVDTNLTYAGQWNQTAGTVTVVTGNTLTFTSVGDTFCGTMTGGGAVDFQGGSDTLTNLTLNESQGAAINGAAVTLSGAISHIATMSITGAVVTIAAGGASLVATGQTVLSDSTANKIVGATSAAILTIDDGFFGAGDLGGGSMSLVNEGSIDGDGANALIIDTGTNIVINTSEILATGAGGVTIASTVDNSGNLFADGGNLTVDGAVTGSGTADVGGATLTFNSTFTEDVMFDGVTGVLKLAHSRTYKGKVGGFSKTGGTSLDLGDIGFVSAGEATYKGNQTGGVLTVTDGTHTTHIAMTGDYRTSTFVAAADGVGGVIVKTTTAPAPPASTTPPHALIAAMAGLGASATAGMIAADAWRAPAALLASPRVAMA